MCGCLADLQKSKAKVGVAIGKKFKTRRWGFWFVPLAERAGLEKSKPKVGRLCLQRRWETAGSKMHGVGAAALGRLFGEEGRPSGGLGCRPFICWLKGKKMGGKRFGAGEGERLWSAGNQEKKIHWWG